jgi:phosphate starvation-inducible PhoH-like protein
LNEIAKNYSHQFELHPTNNQRLANLCGQNDEHLRQIEQRLDVEIRNRGHNFEILGPESTVQIADTILHALYQETEKNSNLSPEQVHLCIQSMKAATEDSEYGDKPETVITCRRKVVRARGLHQQEYIQSSLSHTVTFGIGPAGTGKTYLAVARAVAALESDQVRRIILVRPAVEAGEHLGYLPGDLSQKVDPYFRPLYDALYDLLGFEQTNRFIEQHMIEIVPLAYMRGRTLNDAFIILDEAQNATREQMKMFLTRIGFGSLVMVTGDITQVDLPKGSNSEDIHFTWFDPKDVVRHPLVQSIVIAYEKNDHKGKKRPISFD